MCSIGKILMRRMIGISDVDKVRKKVRICNIGKIYMKTKYEKEMRDSRVLRIWPYMAVYGRIRSPLNLFLTDERNTGKYRRKEK